MQTWVDIPCFDGVYTFKLGPAQIAEIQNKAGVGIGKVFARTMAGRYAFGDGDFTPDHADFRVEELVEIIRQGLIGGKHGFVDGQDVLVTTGRAAELVTNYLLDGADRMALVAIWALAAKILDTLMHGFVPPPEKKAEPAQEPAAGTTRPSTSRKRSATRQ